MYTIELSIFTMAFTVQADRDNFQEILNTMVSQIISNKGLTTRVVPQVDATGNRWMNLTDEKLEKGYQWFDSYTLNAVWASRSIVGFTDRTECDTFHTALQTYFGTSINLVTKATAAYSFYADSSTYIGAFTRDVTIIRESTDSVSIGIK